MKIYFSDREFKMSSKLNIFVLTILAVTLTRHTIDSQSLSVTITPPNAQLAYRGNVTVMCGANLPLTHCQFRVHSWKTSYPTIDFNFGEKSADVMVKGSDRKLKYKGKYSGTGLKNGQCGIALTMVYWGRYLVGCRVRAEKQGWKEAQMTVRSGNNAPSFSLQITPRSALVLPGADLSILCDAKVPITSCSMGLQSETTEVFFNDGPKTTPTGHYQYFGSGLQAGQCGVTLKKVTNADNGPVWCFTEQAGSPGTAMASILTVVSPPGEPTLSLLTGSTYSVGDSLTAECTVRASRPAASITWLLGTKEIRRDDDDDLPVEEWVWPWEDRTVTQRLSVTIKKEHNGMPITCRIDHLALKTSKENKVVILLKSGLPPKLSDCGLQFHGPVTLLIAGGQDAEPGEFPWHAGLFKKDGSAYILQCSGTLITTKLVVTAAHCVYNENTRKVNDKNLYQITLGKSELNWHSDLNDRKVQRMGISEISIPPRYNGRRFNFQYDIAVLRLSTPAKLSDFVGTVCVDWENSFEDTQLVAGNIGIASGWGSTLTANHSEVLQKVDLPFVPENVCLNAIEKHYPHAAIFLTWDKFCAGFLNKATSVCKGDSGSGFIFRNTTTNRYYLRGVVSVSFATSQTVDVCSANLYTGFTGVSNYVEWIRPFTVR